MSLPVAELELLRRVVDAEERQRHQVADELHDDAVQALAASIMHLQVLAGRIAELADEPSYGRGLANLEHGLRAARAVLFRLRAPLLAAQGPGPALAQELERLERASGCATRLDWRVTERLDPLLETVVFRAGQEALHNAARHAKAQRISVAATFSSGALEVEVVDDGAGFDPVGPFSGGLGAAAGRVALAGGRLRVSSTPGQGTCVAVWLPLPAIEGSGLASGG
jgi:signal transduction histidine kinase